MRFHGRNLRKGRFSESGGIYLLTTVTHGRAQIFSDWAAGCLVAREVHAMQCSSAVETLAWVLMPDHLHWLIRMPDGPLGAPMQRLKSRTAISINALLGGSGRVWQAGYHDRAIRKDEDLLAIARYLVANPLRAGLVKRLAEYPFWDAVWL